MNQKEIVKQAWMAAGLYDRTDSKLKEFLGHFDEAPSDCWPELLQKVRENYANHKETLALPIWKTGDKFLRLGLLRVLDAGQDDERHLLCKLAAMCVPETDALELQVLLHLDSPELLEPLHKAVGSAVPTRPGSQLEVVKNLLHLRRGQLARERKGGP